MKNRNVGFSSICITLVVLFLVMGLPQSAYADTVNNTYNTNENGIVVTGSEGEDSSLTVIEKLDGQAAVGESNGEADTSVQAVNPVTGITLDKTSVVLMVGESQNLLPSIRPAEADNKNIIWTSSNMNVATIDETGTVRALSKGTTMISAVTEDGGYTATCNINVYYLLSVPGNELAVAQNYDVIKITWSKSMDATGYEVYRSDAINGIYQKIAVVQTTEYCNTSLKTGTVYYYKVRAYKTIDDTTIYSDYTSAITANTLDKSIGSSLFLYMSDYNNRNSVYQKAVALHNGDAHNTCALTVSEAFRRIELNIPTSTCRTNQVEDHLKARGWKREMNLNLLQPGDICFTTDAYGNLLGGHSTHTFIFMGWVNKEKTLMNICDNQIYTYGSVLHTRTIFRSSLTDATAFFYHTNTADINSILKIASTAHADSLSYNKVKISWNAASGAYGYYVYRATSKYGFYRNIATISNTSFTDNYLSTGTTYYYKVRAYSKLGTSKIYGSYSPIYAATPTLSTPFVYGNSISKGKAKLSWNGIIGASGYQIYRSTIKNGTYTHVSSISSTSYTNSGLVSGKDYYYKVRAYRYARNKRLFGGFSYVNIKTI